MRLLTADKTGLHAGLAAMADEATVYGVKRKGTGFAYGRLSAEDDLRLDYDITLLPPNKYWLPEETPLFRYEPPPKARTLPAGQSGPAIVIGVHPYDLHALKTLDAVFLGYGPDDSYKARREANVIVGVDCLHPWPYAFAPSMGTALPPEGLFDLWLTDLGDAYLIEAATEKGSALCKRYLKTRVAAKTAAPRRDELRAEALGRYRLRLDVPAAEIPRVLDAGWDSPMWEELGRKCFSCASCTMTCPTCVCFRIMDRNAADGTSGCACAGGIAACSTASPRWRAEKTSALRARKGCVTGCTARGNICWSVGAPRAASAAAAASTPASSTSQAPSTRGTAWRKRRQEGRLEAGGRARHLPSEVRRSRD